MKKFINILAIAMFLVACSSVNSEAASTTTVAPIPKYALPKRTECPIQKINLETSEVFKDIIRCVDKWAVGIPQRFVEKFTGDTDVEGEWVITSAEGKWTVVGVCHIYHPIYSSGPVCNNPYNTNPIDLDLIPPMPVQCVLWDGASLESNIPETGCPKDSKDN